MQHPQRLLKSSGKKWQARQAASFNRLSGFEILEDRRMLAAQFQVAHALRGADGYYPVAELTLVGSNLFGTTDSGGSAGGGTVFSMNTPGSGFQVVHSFPGGEGDGPLAELTLGGSTLYGTTAYGGAAHHGTIFSMNTDGSGYQVLHTFTGAANDGADPNGTAGWGH